MIEKIDEDELVFMECYNNSIAMAECLFSDYDNLALMEGEKLGHVRLGQLVLLSHEYLLDDTSSERSLKENFALRKNIGDIYCLGGRLFGKTLFVEKVDMLINMVCSENERVGFSSYDQIHIRGVLEEVVQAAEFHPFLQVFEPHSTKSPNYRISAKNGYLLESVNMNVSGKKPGSAFFQKHFSRLYIEEASMEPDVVYSQRRDSVSELGCTYRISGMTNFTKHSPCGRVFYDYQKKPWIINLPQTINPNWDEAEKQKALRDFGGEQSIPYLIFIKGEVVESGISVFDMQRVRKCYNEDKHVKNFEISKESFPMFKEILVIERPKNAQSIYIFADIGESAPTEIGIIFEVNQLYKYIYNITCYNLTDREQKEIFQYLGNFLEANFIAIDCTDGTGRAIYRGLGEVFPADNLRWVSFNEKIPVDFEKDKNGNIVFDKGKPVYKEEYVSDWAVKHLKDMLYNGRIEIPTDYKFDIQLNQVVAMQSGTRTVYECLASENHLFQAFQVFSICHWYTEFILNKAIRKQEYYKGIT